MAEEAEEAEEGALSPFAEGLKPSPAATDEEEEEASVAIRERLEVVVGEEQDFFLWWVGEEEDLNLMSLPRTGMTGTERDGIRKTSDNTLLPLTIVFRFSPLPFFHFSEFFGISLLAVAVKDPVYAGFFLGC